MGNKRPPLIFDDDTETVDVQELAGRGRSKKTDVDPKTVQEIAALSGFPSRGGRAQVHRRRRRKTPYTTQLGLKVRPEMRDLFHDMGEHLAVYDHTVFERGLLALIEKEGTAEQLKIYKDIIE